MEINKSNIPLIFIINLKRSPDRRLRMEALFQQYNLNYAWIDAMDGFSLSDEEYQQYYNDNLRQQFQWIDRPLKKTEVAVYLSHMKIFEKMIKENIGHALVFEDDIQFNSDFVEIIKKQNQIPKNYEFIYFDHGRAKYYPRLKKIHKNYKLIKYRRMSKHSKRTIIFCGAYQISRAGAIRLFSHAFPILMPIDYFIGHLNIHHLKCYGIEPYCCWQDTLKNPSTHFEERVILPPQVR